MEYFTNVTFPKDEPWLVNIYTGPRDHSGIHTHMVISGANLVGCRFVWYYRNLGRVVIVKKGELTMNTSLSDFLNNSSS